MPLLGRLAAPASLAFLAVSAVACSATPPAAPPKPCDVQVVTLDIYAAGNLNPDEGEKPRPVVVRLYQLKNDVRIENATYDEILLKDKEVLEDDIVKMDEVSVFPNDHVQVKFERMKAASTLAGVGLFHSPKGNSWKTTYGFPLPPGEVTCGGRPDADGGAPAPVADPRIAFFLDATKIDNGAQFDASMFPNADAVRSLDLPRMPAAPNAPSAPGTPAAPGAPSAPGMPAAPAAPAAPTPPALPGR